MSFEPAPAAEMEITADRSVAAVRALPESARWAIHHLLPYVGATLACLLLVFSFFHLWGRDIETPIDRPAGDYMFSAFVAKAAMTGAYFENHALGAPFGSELYDFPMADSFHLLFFRFWGLFSANTFLAVNVFYIAGYVLISLTSLYLFRSLGLPLLPSISAGLLAAFLPHHWMRGEFHLLLSAYYLVPLMVLVLIRAAQGVPLLTPTNRRGIGGYAPTRAGWISLAICLAMGSGGVYYALFAIFFLLIAGLYSLRRTGWKSVVTEVGILVLALGGSFTLNMLPSAWYFLRHGRDPEVAKRLFWEADVYGFKIAGLLLPIQNHRIPSWAHAKSTYVATEAPFVPQQDLTAALGLVGAAGFLLLLGWSFSAAAGNRNHGILGPLSVFNLAALLLGTIGGFGSLFNYFISPQLRCYHRISVYVSLFCFTALLVAIQWLAERRVWGLSPAWITNAAAVILFVGIWDITPVFGDNYPANRQWLENNRAFIRAIESKAPTGSMIFQLPYQAFPEPPGPFIGMLPYDPLVGYLFSDRLRWSYAAIHGRPEENAGREASGFPAPQMVTRLRELGFTGIYLDRKGYADVAVEAQLIHALGPKTFEDAEHRRIYFSLNGNAVPPIGAWNEIRMPVAAAVEDCYFREPNGNSWCSNRGKLAISNPDTKARHILLTFELYAGIKGPSHVKMSGALSEDQEIDWQPRSFKRELTVLPGKTIISMEADGKALVSADDPRNKVFAILDLRAQQF